MTRNRQSMIYIDIPTFDKRISEKGNRAKSAAISAYESTPLSYVNKGKEIELKNGQIFIMNFKLKEDETEKENLPNYSYEIVE